MSINIPSDSHPKLSIVEQFEAMAANYPQHIAATSPKQSINYAVLNESANRLGHTLLKKNVPNSQPIVLLIDHTVQMCIGILGVIKSGHFYSALNPSYPIQHLCDILDDLQPSLLITEKQFSLLAQHLTQHYPIEVIFLEDLDHSLPQHNLDLKVDSEQPLAIFYTSGSTGQPKGVVRNHRSMVHRLFSGQHKQLFPLSSRIAMLQPCNLANSANDFYTSLTSGNTLCFFNINEIGLQGFAQWLDTEQITHLHTPIVLLRQFGSTGIQGVAIYRKKM